MAPPILKMKFITRFPAVVEGSGFVTVVKSGLTYTFGADYSDLFEESSSVDTASFIAGQNTDGSFYKITVANLVANNQPLDPTLTALAALNATPGLVEQTGADTFTKRAMGVAAPTDVLTLNDGDNRYQPLDTDLTAIAALSSAGLVARTGVGTAAVRTLTGTASQVSVTNGDGVSGNPTIALTDTAVTPGTYTYSTLTVDQQGRLTAASSGSAPSAPIGLLTNCGLSSSVGASALTITLTDAAGATPSGGSSVSIPFRSATAGTGTITQRTVSAATTLVISSGSTLGTVSATPFNIYVAAFDDAGTIRLAAIQCALGTSVLSLPEFDVASSTAEGGAGAADSAQVWYTGTAVSSKAFTILGRLEFNSGQATAGTWATNADKVDVAEVGFRLPGMIVDRARGLVTANVTQTATTPIDNTIPQISEGVELTTAAITLKSGASRIRGRAMASLTHNTVAGAVALHVHRNATADAIGVTLTNIAKAAGDFINGALTFEHTPAATGASTYRLRGGTNTGAFYSGGYAATPYFNGTYQSVILEIEEIMA